MRGLSSRLLSYLISFAGAIITLYPGNPNNMILPSRDSGVFLYVGWRWINGSIPYRDVWDHKPPLVYLVDALGLSISPESLWGVWSLQFIFVLITFLLIYKVLEGNFGLLSALAGTIVLASGLLTLIEQGNVTEEYALVFQAACFYLFISAHKRDYPIHLLFWNGLCAGLAFNFKQTTIGAWIGCGLILLLVRWKERKSPLPDFAALLAGWLIPSIAAAIYLSSRNALADFWEQAYLYNFIYVGKHEGIARLLPVFLKGFLLLSQGGVLYIALFGWLAGAASVWAYRKTAMQPLLVVALLDLPIEVVLITTSGRSIIHYYLTLLPAMAILAGSLVYVVPSLMNRIPNGSFRRFQAWAPSILLAAIALSQIGQIRNYPIYVRTMAINEYAAAIDYVRANTAEKDKVLVIGAESVVNFLARRESPTRYVYQYPLALLGRRPMFEEYFNQILENKPVLIIDTRGRKRLTDRLYEPLQKRSEIVREGVKYLGENYEQVARFDEWVVYRLVEKP